jgi:hypothetical protein
VIYVASPYTDLDESVRGQRYREVRDYIGQLYESDLIAYSPICHCHPIAEEFSLPTDWAFWAEMDERILSVCTCVHVLMLDGWKDSQGIKSELSIAEKMGLPVVYIEN